MPYTFPGLDDVDWSALCHAYGTAEEVPGLLRAMASGDAEDRGRALSRFHSAVHHQGDVVSCTTATVPFLLELARTPDTPDRAAIVGLLVSIGTNAVERYDELYTGYDGTESNHALAADLIRARADEFVAYAADGDHRLRHAAIPALAQFIDDAPCAVGLVRDRFRAERRTVERLLLVETMARLTLRLPGTVGAAVAWFDALAADEGLEPESRLAALAQRTRCAPERIGPDLIPAAVALLHEIALSPLPPSAWVDPAVEEASVETPVENSAEDAENADAAAVSDAVSDVPPQVVEAFRQLEHQNTVYAPTTGLLRTFHAALGTRVAERTALLVVQLDSTDPGSRLDALRMAGKLMGACRGDHSALIKLVAERLDDACPEVSAQAAQILSDCHAIAGPARDALAAHVSAQAAARSGIGAGAWAAPELKVRRAYQNAVLSLARLGDDRAVPPLLAALDGEVDAWRAAEVAGSLPRAADELTPRLCRRLATVELASLSSADIGTRALLAALGRLADPAALPTVIGTLDSAVRLENWSIVANALSTVAALAAHGESLGAAPGESVAAEPGESVDAAQAMSVVRSLTGCSDGHVRSAAAKALAALGAGPDELMPLVLDALTSSNHTWVGGAVEILGALAGPIDPRAEPLLRKLLEHRYEWTRIQAAAGLWLIVGEAETEVEAETVLDTLLQAWDKNGATANVVVRILATMGPAAAPALPTLIAELARTRRSGHFASIENDEELQRAIRDLIGRLA